MTTNSIAQFITVLILFIAVLVLTGFVSMWIARYQKVQEKGTNIEVIETARISSTKYIQLVRIGERYVAYAVCKDTVTKLADVPEEEIQTKESIAGETKSFKDVLELLKIQKQ
jgi:flagellar protein FliO/FliZ